ncbi:PREDICTED: cystatin-F [Nanorana parkeri]|uniref:cystatin-F n=1 Tax=Nanorana parkeri TaxID=125878 RepID=UPI00085433A9|nr:PREDICTED: cystatin-F [Nanorana parkeri]
MSALLGLVILLMLGARAQDATNTDIRPTTVDPGFPRNASTNDPEVQKAVRITVYAYNNISNDAFLFKDLEIEKAMIQVVKGIKYMIRMKLARTICYKSMKDFLDECDFQQSKQLKQIFKCYSEVWKISWQHTEKVSILECS